MQLIRTSLRSSSDKCSCFSLHDVLKSPVFNREAWHVTCSHLGDGLHAGVEAAVTHAVRDDDGEGGGLALLEDTVGGDADLLRDGGDGGVHQLVSELLGGGVGLVEDAAELGDHLGLLIGAGVVGGTNKGEEEGGGGKLHGCDSGGEEGSGVRMASGLGRWLEEFNRLVRV